MLPEFPMNTLFILAEAAPASVPIWLTAPFVLLLLLIAVMPLTPHGLKHFWEKAYVYIAPGLGALVAAWYLLNSAHGGSEVLAVFHEYAAFIALIGSLFVVAGGLHLGVRGAATPMENVRFLALGALVANLIGTTGASMVFIRPWLRMNKGRISPYHVVFFIFVVSNCGGALTPIGDPPLFLGYLRGVPFFWLLGNAFLPWLTVLGLLLVVFWVIDRRADAKVSPKLRAEEQLPDEVSLGGYINYLFLAAVVGAVFIPGTVPGLREGVMVAVAALSYRLTPKAVHEANAFSFGPIREVAVLFAGIFFTMMPALNLIEHHGQELGVKRPMQYYVAAGSLSSVLDNAPTYATFFELARASARADHAEEFKVAEAAAGDKPAGYASTLALLQTAPALVIAVSLGAVFFGAMTYIGNGPNFMVKAIAESAQAPTPSFFGYVFRFALPILLPILLLTGWIFL